MSFNVRGSPSFPHRHVKYLRELKKKQNYFTIHHHNNLVRPHGRASHMNVCCSVGYYSVTGWLEAQPDGGNRDHSCIVIRTQGHDLWTDGKTENGRLPSGPPSEEIALGRVNENCKWK